VLVLLCCCVAALLRPRLWGDREQLGEVDNGTNLAKREQITSNMANHEQTTINLANHEQAWPTTSKLGQAWPKIKVNVFLYIKIFLKATFNCMCYSIDVESTVFHVLCHRYSFADYRQHISWHIHVPARIVGKGATPPKSSLFPTTCINNATYPTMPSSDKPSFNAKSNDAQRLYHEMMSGKWGDISTDGAISWAGSMSLPG